MPHKLPSACRVCNRRDCTVHQRRWLDPRANAARRGYDATWRKLRLSVLADEPLCRHHAEKGHVVPATEVHHEKPLRLFPELRLVRSNLVPLCKPCHSAINDYGEGGSHL